MPVVGNYVTTENRRDIKLPIADVVTGTVAADGAIPSVATIAALRAGSGGSADGQIVYVKGFAAAGDGGEGHFVWNAASTATDNTGTIIKATPTTGRWLRQREGKLLSIRAFGARGDGSTDDTTAVQAAVDSGVGIFVPIGNYRLTSAVLLPGGTIPVTLIGEGGISENVNSRSAFIDYRSGTPEEPLFHRAARWYKLDKTWHDDDPGNNIWPGHVVVHGIDFTANPSNPYAQLVDIQGGISVEFSNCRFSQVVCRGLTLGRECYDIRVDHCYAEGVFHYYHYYGMEETAKYELARRCWGFGISNHASVTQVSANGCGTGMYLAGHGVHVSGCRNENNVYGFIIGSGYIQYSESNNFGIFSSNITACSAEANGVGFFIPYCSYGTRIANITVQGTYSAGGQYQQPNSTHGVIIERVDIPSTIEDIQTYGNFDRGGIINQETKGRGSIKGLYGAGTTGAKVGGIRAPFSAMDPSQGLLPAYHVINYPLNPAATNDRHKTITSFHDLMLPGLTGLNLRDKATSGNAQGGAVFSKQLGDVIAIGNGETSKAVAFHDKVAAAYVPWLYDLYDDANSKITPGTYYYAVILVGKTGELFVEDQTSYKAITVSTTGKKIHIYHYAHAGYRKRLYRSRIPFDFSNPHMNHFVNYWSRSETDVDFFDLGDNDDGTPVTPYDGAEMPLTTSSWIASLYEDDANYQIVATPSWGTTVYVTNKATTGFTLNFGTAAPDANQTVAWLMFRP